ncbi:hypothetical protein D9M68_669570 [compost metagenome]
MYFSPEQSAGALRRLLSCLTAEGLLLLSAVEAGLATQAGFNGFWAGSNYALRPGSRLPARPAAPPPLPRVEQPFLWQPASAPQTKRSEPEPPPSAPELPQQRGSDSLWPQARQALEQGRHPQCRKILLEYLASPGLTQAERHQACLLMVRSWADQQRGDEAEPWLQRALALDPTSAVAHWLAAMLAQQAGDEPTAMMELQKVLYLDPEFILAHFHLARLLRGSGQRPASARALRNCRELLARQPPEAPVPQGDGLSCGQLLRLCEQLMEANP